MQRPSSPNDWNIESPKVMVNSHDGRPGSIKTIFKPKVVSIHRSLISLEVDRNLTNDQVVLKIKATDQARHEGLFDKLAKKYGDKAKIQQENLTAHNNIKVPVLHITVPYKDLAAVLQDVNNEEKSSIRIPAQRLTDMVQSVSDDVVKSIAKGFNNIFGNK